MEPVYRMFAGGVAGATAMVLTYPLDVVKSRLAVEGGRAQYRGVAHCVKSVIKAEGVRGLYRGVIPSVIAIAPFLAVQQSCFDFLKHATSHRLDATIPTFVVLGATAGLAAQTVVHPFDVVRRRMQVDTSHGKLRSGWRTAQRVLARHGVAGLYRGYVATALKIMPAVAISLVVRDSLLGRVDVTHRARRSRAQAAARR